MRSLVKKVLFDVADLTGALTSRFWTLDKH